jgi:hypothetical protein
MRGEVETMRTKCKIGVGVLLLAGCSEVWAQEPQTSQQPEATVAPAGDAPAAGARLADVLSIEAIVKAFYDTVSGPAGTPRQWERARALFLPGARVVSIGVAEGETDPRAKAIDHQQFMDESDAAMVRDGFYEKETNRVVRRFGNVAHVFSTFETRQSSDGPVKQRGVNSLDLFFDGTRWWIAATLWDVERLGNPIPDSLQRWGLDCGGRGGKKGGKSRKKTR